MEVSRGEKGEHPLDRKEKPRDVQSRDLEGGFRGEEKKMFNSNEMRES